MCVTRQLFTANTKNRTLPQPIKGVWSGYTIVSLVNFVCYRHVCKRTNGIHVVYLPINVYFDREVNGAPSLQCTYILTHSCQIRIPHKLVSRVLDRETVVYLASLRGTGKRMDHATRVGIMHVVHRSTFSEAGMARVRWWNTGSWNWRRDVSIESPACSRLTALHRLHLLACYVSIGTNDRNLKLQEPAAAQQKKWAALESLNPPAK